MEKTLVIKSEYAPIIRHPQGHGFYICWDYEPDYEDDGNGNIVEANHGRCCMYHLPYTNRPEMDAVKIVVINGIDSETRESIVNFIYNNLKINLSTEMQQNIKSWYDMINMDETFLNDIKIKGKVIHNDVEDYLNLDNQYISFNTKEDYYDFYKAMIKHINYWQSFGWQRKEDIDWSVFEVELNKIKENGEENQVNS